MFLQKSFSAWIDTCCNDDTQLVQEIYRYRYYRHRKHIGRWRDHSSQYQYHYDSMSSIGTHEFSSDDAHFSEEVYDHRQLKHDTTTQHHHGHEADIIIEGKKVVDLAADGISGCEVQ